MIFSRHTNVNKSSIISLITFKIKSLQQNLITIKKIKTYTSLTFFSSKFCKEILYLLNPYIHHSGLRTVIYLVFAKICVRKCSLRFARHKILHLRTNKKSTTDI